MAAPTGSFGPYSLASGSRKEDKSPSRLFNRIVSVSASEEFWATGSNWGAAAFITDTATSGLIFAYNGGQISSSDVVAGQMYEIAVKRVSGSDATTYLLYP